MPEHAVEPIDEGMRAVLGESEPSGSLTKDPPQLGITDELEESVGPLARRAHQESVDPIAHDLARVAHIRGDDRESRGRVLHRLERELSPLERSVRERHDADVEVDQILSLPLCRTAHDLDRDAEVRDGVRRTRDHTYQRAGIYRGPKGLAHEVEVPQARPPSGPAHDDSVVRRPARACPDEPGDVDRHRKHLAVGIQLAYMTRKLLRCDKDRGHAATELVVLGERPKPLDNARGSA